MIPYNKLNERLESWIGDLGAASVRQLKNRLSGNIEGELSIAQKMAKDRFINDFMAKAYSVLNSEIQSGRINPSIRIQAPAKPQTKTSNTTSSKTPEQIRKEKQAAASITAQQQMAKSSPVNKESRYRNLNAIFESLLTEAESISQFFTRWLTAYLPATDINNKITQDLIKKIESSYSTDRGKQALTQLANLVYASTNSPRTRSTDKQYNRTTRAAPQSTTDSKELAGNIKKALITLSKMDNKAYASLVQDLVAAAKTPMPSTNEPEPITIGGQKILPSDPAYSKIMKSMSAK